MRDMPILPMPHSPDAASNLTPVTPSNITNTPTNAVPVENVSQKPRTEAEFHAQRLRSEQQDDVRERR